MKKLIIFFCITVFVSAANHNIKADDENDFNIISYYAVGNSLDGQPMIEMQNKLRFFPVFIYKDATEYVNVTLYYGTKSRIYKKEANKKDDGHYWEVDLPPFYLGDAIQRLEVETKIKLEDPMFKAYKKKLEEIDNTLKESNSEYNKLMQDLADSLRSKITMIKASLEALDNTVISFEKNFMTLNSLIATLNQDISKDTLKTTKDSIYLKLDKIKSSIDTLLNINNSTKSNLTKIINEFQDLLSKAVEEKMIIIGKNYLTSAISKENLLDSTKREIRKQMRSNFVKNDIAGPDITEADIIIDDSLKFVKILYRNYKKSLRQLPALDPAESMGIFRVRYVPFPITGKKMWRPLQQNSIAVFEFGIGFGDVRLSGDDFVKPTLSFDRLGVAFAISNELFSDSARIVALALTYDFNAYGSLGVGANFRDPEGQSDVQPYFSFGINKKAFEFLVGQLAGFFGVKK